MTTLAGDDPDYNAHRTEPPLLHDSTSPSENWDDDFEFQAGVVAGARDSAHDAMNAHTSPRQSLDQEESWDDAYEDENTPSLPVKRASKVEEDDVEDWDSSDNELENHHHHQKDIRHDQTREFGMSGFEEEDKTVTARSTSSQPRVPLPVLPLPIPPAHSGNLFQAHTVLPSSTTSPTLSTFSIPLSSTTRDRASIYSQDPLMPTSNSSAPHLSVMRSYPHAAGSTPPRKGRRLRKKSRPPEADIFELEDHEPNPIPAPVPPPIISTDQNISSPTTPPRAQQTVLESPSRPSQPSGPPTPSSSLLTRIGSFKRWARRSIGPDDPVLSGWRRSKSSTGPSEAKSSHGPNDVISRGGKSSTGPEGRTSTEDGIELRLRPASPTPAPKRLGRRSRGESASGQKSGWFFRAGGAAGSEREEVTPTAQTPELTPSKRGTALGLRRRSKVRGEGEEDVDGEGKPPTPRKFKARLVPALKSEGPVGLHRQGEPKSPTRPSRRSPSRDAPDSQPQSAKRPMSMLFPRNGNGNASIGRKAGIPVAESASTGSAVVPVRDGASGDEKTHVDSGDKEGGREGGMRSLMNGVRRLSLVGANPGHKRTKSTGGEDGAEESPRKDGTNRPRSQTDHLVGGLKVDQASLQSPILRLAPRQGDGNGLLPPVELEPSSMAGIFARRGSLPWADYDRTSGAEPHAGASAGSALKPPPAIVADRPHSPPHRQSCSTVSSSSSSRNASSGNLDWEPPMKHSHSTASVPLPVPVSSKPIDAVPQSRPLASPAPTEQRSGFESRHRVPVQPQSPSKFPMPTSPQSASLGRSTASPSHPAGLRRNSLGDLKTPLNTLGEHKAQLPPLGELKIPARISRAQQGLRRDMGMVKEFAGCVEQLKRLQATYMTLLGDLRAAYEASSGTSPPGAAHVQFHLPSRPSSQIGSHRKTITSNSNPSVQSISLNSPTQTYPLRTASRASQDISRELVRLEHEYGIWWECAELLIELGGGSGVAGAASYPNLATLSTSTVDTPAAEDPLKPNSTEEQPILKKITHVSSMSEPGSLFEQALSSTLNSKGPPQASPPHLSQWRASTGRHDLSARQLRLLRDMLNTPDPASLAHAAGPYGYGAGYPHPHLSTTAEAPPWVTWNPSTVTLPSEESSADAHSHGTPPAIETRGEGKEKKRRASRLGMLGLREILRGLKRTAVAEGRLDTLDKPVQGHQDSESGVCHIAEDDHYNRRRSPWHQHDEHHAAKLSTGPELAAPMDHPPTRTHPPKSPRRPSLASIFRIGNKHMKSTNVNGKLIRDGDASPKENGNSTPEEERMSPLGSAAAGEYADWDRMSRSDLDLTAVGSGTATVRAKKSTRVSHSSTNLNCPYSNANGVTPKKTPATSQTSLRDLSPSSAISPQPSRLPLSIVEEGGGRNAQRARTPDVSRPKDRSKDRTSSWSQAHPPRPVSRTGKTAISGTVRSAPPNDFSTPASKLALTPENIKPLLEYAKEVGTRLSECINEVQILLGAGTTVL